MTTTKANTRSLLAEIAADMASDAKVLDSQQMTGSTIGTHLGRQAAAIARLAEVLEGVVPVHTTNALDRRPQMSDPDGQPSPSHIWQVLSPLLEDLWIPPVSVQVSETGGSVAIRYPTNNRNAVQAAYTELGVDAVPQLDLSYVWNEGNEREFVTFGLFNKFGQLKSPLLPGVSLEIYCHLHTQADASEHWDGLILHPAMAGRPGFLERGWIDPGSSGEPGLSLTHCNHFTGCREPLGEDASDMFCGKHPTIDQIVAGAVDA